MITVEANGAKIPSIGLGTWALRGEVATRMVASAIESGYRHIDTAARYENEAAVGEGLRASSVPRSEIFLTTKIWPDCFRADDFRASVKERLDLLKVDHVDLLLLHWPNDEVPLAETIEALNWAKATGLTRHIGVSNFTTRHIAEAVRLSTAPLVCNQVEYHPFLLQDKVMQATRAAGMAFTAYRPINRGVVQDNETIAGIAKKHGKSAVQVTLRWLVQQDGVVAIPRTSNPGRAAENIDIFDFGLDGAEMAAISALRSPGGRMVNLDIAPEWD
ncbi:MAG: aldo/keto reductase [Geminicoccaceae bacterium]|nr:aldo/keto reductase [Geminicoccaceae bacterium]